MKEIANQYLCFGVSKTRYMSCFVLFESSCSNEYLAVMILFNEDQKSISILFLYIYIYIYIFGGEGGKRDGPPRSLINFKTDDWGCQ